MIETITSAKLITEKFKRVAMLASFRDSNFAGVLFNDNAGYVVHEEGHYLIKIHGKNLLAGQNRSFPYYHYAKNDFIRNDLVGRKPNGETVRLTLDFIESRFSLARPQFRIRVPVYHVMRQIYQLYPTMKDRKHLRLIFEVSDGNQMEGNEFPAKFKYEHGEWVYRSNLLEKPCILHRFRTAYNIQEGVSYIVEPTSEESTHIVVKIIKPFFAGCRIGMFETRTAYLEQYDRQLDLDLYYPPEKLIYWPILLRDVNYGEFQKVVMKALYFFEIMRLFSFCDFVDIYTSQNALAPICFEGVRKKESDPIIQAMLAPIDPTIRGGE